MLLLPYSDKPPAIVQCSCWCEKPHFSLSCTSLTPSITLLFMEVKSPDFQILPEDLTWHTNSSIPASLKNKQKHTKDSGLSRCQELLYSSYLTLVQASLCGTLWLHIHKALLNCIITCIPVNPAMVPSWKDIFWSSQVLFLQLYVFLESRRAVHRHVWVQTSHSCPVVTRHWGFWSKRTDTWRIRSSCKDL